MTRVSVTAGYLVFGTLAAAVLYSLAPSEHAGTYVPAAERVAMGMGSAKLTAVSHDLARTGLDALKLVAPASDGAQACRAEIEAAAQTALAAAEEAGREGRNRQNSSLVRGVEKAYGHAATVCLQHARAACADLGPATATCLTVAAVPNTDIATIAAQVD